MADAESLVGKTLSHYRILEKLGGGGMGVVYKVHDKSLDRFVALKFLPDELAKDTQVLNRFRREARAASALNHPNICTIYEIGEAQGQHFIAMELLEGQTLEQLIQGKPLSTERSLEFAIQIAQGLQAAHAKGVVHRDIKPSNILVTEGGLAKIMDFGLTRQVGHGMEEGPSPPGEIAGTLAYMPPEQATGREFGARGDLFSFGAVLYEMVTGKKPFQGRNSIAVLDAILHTRPELPSHLNPKVPHKIDKIISTALEKDLDQRYQSAEQVLNDLQQVKAGLGSTAEYQGGKSQEIHVAKFCEAVSKRSGVLFEQVLDAIGGIAGLYLEKLIEQRGSQLSVTTTHAFASRQVPLKQLLREIQNCSGVNPKKSRMILAGMEEVLRREFRKNEVFQPRKPLIFAPFGSMEVLDLEKSIYRLNVCDPAAENYRNFLLN
jgi:serine/threonine protein kinase